MKLILKNNLRILTADKGYFLCRKSENIFDLSNSTCFRKTIYLGINDSHENYVEVTEEKANNYLKEWEQQNAENDNINNL